jgi:Wzt C-terminal domain
MIERFYMNLVEGRPGFGAGGILIETVRLRDTKGRDVLQATVGETLTIDIRARATKTVRQPNLGFILNMLAGELVYGISALNLGVRLADLTAGDPCHLVAEFEASLAAGSYSITVLAADVDGALTGDSGVHHDTRERLGPLVILPGAMSGRFQGIGDLPGAFSVQKIYTE